MIIDNEEINYIIDIMNHYEREHIDHTNTSEMIYYKLNEIVFNNSFNINDSNYVDAILDQYETEPHGSHTSASDILYYELLTISNE